VAIRAWPQHSPWFADLYVLTGRDGFHLVVSGRSLIGLVRGSRAAFGLAFPGCASRLTTDCGLAQQRRDAVVVLEVGMPTAVL
jgi:hypothetical protein